MLEETAAEERVVEGMLWQKTVVRVGVEMSEE